MCSMNSTDSWTGSCVEEEVITAAMQAEYLNESSGGNSLDNLDDSLTSLQWLHEFSILGTSGSANGTSNQHQSNLFGQQLGSDAPVSPLAGDPATFGMPFTPDKPTAAAVSRMPPVCTLPSLIVHGHCPDEVDYKTNPHIKPPFSYATLICMAMQASKKSKMTLSCIYKWITDNFCYFRHADPTWQNSIRHNLSLNKCFIKVPRQKDEPGKGGFWKIDPQYAERLLTGASKKKRMPPVRINPALQKQLKLAPQSTTTGETTTRVFNISPNTQDLLDEFEEVSRVSQNSNPQPVEAAMFDCWDLERRHKRKQPFRQKVGGNKRVHCSSSPLMATEDPIVLDSLKSHFDWDALIDSALKSDLILSEGGPLSPIAHDKDLTVHGIHINPLEDPSNSAVSNVLLETQRDSNMPYFDEETFLATDLLQSAWSEEDERNHSDFPCSSISNDLFFDLGDSLEGDMCLL